MSRSYNEGCCTIGVEAFDRRMRVDQQPHARNAGNAKAWPKTEENLLRKRGRVQNTPICRAGSMERLSF